MGNLSVSNCQQNSKQDDKDLARKDHTDPPDCNKDTDTRLRKAVKEYLEVKYDSAKLRKIRALLKSGKSVANVFISQCRLFEIVCRIKPPEHAKMSAQIGSLLEVFKCNGIDFNARNQNGETFLMFACENKRFDIVRSLINMTSREFVLDIDAVDNSGETAFMKAKRNEDTEIAVALLILKSISAVENEMEDIVKSLIDEFRNASEISVKSWSSNGKHHVMSEKKKTKFEIWRDAMYIAMEKDTRHSEEIFKLLLNCDVVFGLEDAIGHTILYKLIEHLGKANNKTLRLIEMLLQSGQINMNAREMDGKTVLHLVKDRKLGLLFIRYGADVNAKDKEGKTPLMSMCATNDCKESVLRTTLEKTGTLVDLNVMDCDGRTALIMHAVSSDSPNRVKFLLNAGASVNLSDHLGFTALHQALYTNIEGNEEFPRNCEELKKRNEMFITNEDRWYVGTKTVEMLLQKPDVDVNALSFENFSPLDIAEGWNTEIPSSIKDALKKRGAILNVFRQIESQSTSEFHLDFRCRMILQRLFNDKVNSIFPIEENVAVVKERLLTIIKRFQEQIVSGKDKQGRTALHLTAISFSINSAVNYWTFGRDEDNRYGMSLANTIVDELISLGCNVNETDNFGRTPLHYANTTLWNLLISKGADAAIKDKDGNSATDETSRRKHGRGYNARGHFREKVPFDRQQAESFYDRNEVAYFLRLVNDKQIEIYVKNSDSEEKPAEDSISPLAAIFRMAALDSLIPPRLLWEEGDYTFRHPLLNQITDEVTNLMNAIAKEIERLDPRFEIRLESVGSSNEGTKIGEPDEFDFCFVLTKISELCEVSLSPELPPGFVRLKRKPRKVGERSDFDSFFGNDGILNTEKLKWQFTTRLRKVVVFIERQQSFDCNLEIETTNVDLVRRKSNYNKIHKVSSLKIVKPVNFSSVDTIAIDIVPCIHVDGWWPDEAISNVSDDIKTFGCNLVFDRPQKLYPWVPYSESCAGISFSKSESDAIKRSCDNARQAYMIAKVMFANTLLSHSNYTLKNSLLYCIEALTPTSEKATQLRLSFEEMESKFHQMDRYLWLKCLMKCQLEFVTKDFCPCYFIPKFSSPIGTKHLKRYSVEWMTYHHYKFPELCKKAYAFYRCNSNDTSESCYQFSIPDPLWERFDRDKFIANLCEIAYK